MIQQKGFLLSLAKVTLGNSHLGPIVLVAIAVLGAKTQTWESRNWGLVFTVMVRRRCIMYPSKEFIEVYERLCAEHACAAWLSQHEAALRPLIWAMWKSGREKLNEELIHLQLKHAA